MGFLPVGTAESIAGDKQVLLVLLLPGATHPAL